VFVCVFVCACSCGLVPLKKEFAIRPHGFKVTPLLELVVRGSQDVANVAESTGFPCSCDVLKLPTYRR